MARKAQVKVEWEARTSTESEDGGRREGGSGPPGEAVNDPDNVAGLLGSTEACKMKRRDKHKQRANTKGVDGVCAEHNKGAAGDSGSEFPSWRTPSCCSWGQECPAVGA
ncbi:uncharacterized protein PS065_017302 [Dugong dugon]